MSNELSDRERAIQLRLAGEAVEAVCGGDTVESGQVLDLLLRLVDKSLVVMDERFAETHYYLLATIREYALNALRQSESETDRRARHLDFYIGLAEEAEPRLAGASQLEWLDQLDLEHDNLRAALEFALRHQPDQAVRLAGALWGFWFMRGHFREGRRNVERALAAPAEVAPLFRAKVLTGAAFALFQDDYAPATSLSEEALDISRGLNYTRGVAFAFHHLGSIAASAGRHQPAQELFDEGLSVVRRAGDATLRVMLLVDLGLLALMLGDPARATERLEEALALYRHRGDRWSMGYDLGNLAEAARQQGDYARAQATLEEAIALLRQVKDKHGLAAGLVDQSSLARLRGDYRAAAHALDEAVPLLQLLAEKEYFAFYLSERARLAMVAHLDHKAARLLGAAQAIRTQAGTALAPSNRADWERDVAGLQAALGEAGFAAAWEAGQALTLEQAMTLSLEDSDIGGSGPPPAPAAL